MATFKLKKHYFKFEITLQAMNVDIKKAVGMADRKLGATFTKKAELDKVKRTIQPLLSMLGRYYIEYCYTEVMLSLM